MTSSSLSEIHAALLELQGALMQPGADLAVEPLRRDLDRIIALVEAQVPREAPATAYERYERLQTIEPAFESLHRKWSEVRDAIASEAAKELRDGLNLEVGWQQRWGPLFDVAWKLRKSLQLTAPDPKGRGGDAARRFGLPPDRRGTTSDTALALDLRYAASLPLVQIGGLVGLSPAAVQLRIFDFEDAVLREFGHEAIERQVPEGWRLVSHGEGLSSVHSSRRLLLRRAGGGVSEVVVTLVPIKDDRDASAGRPRSVARLELDRERGRGIAVWAVVMEAGPEVMFVPSNAVTIDELRGESLIAVARKHGLRVLADAIEAAARGGERMT